MALSTHIHVEADATEVGRRTQLGECNGIRHAARVAAQTEVSESAAHRRDRNRGDDANKPDDHEGFHEGKSGRIERWLSCLSDSHIDVLTLVGAEGNFDDRPTSLLSNRGATSTRCGDRDIRPVRFDSYVSLWRWPYSSG